MNTIQMFTPSQNSNEIEDSRGISPYLYLIENHENDLHHLNLLMDHLESIRLRECETTHLILQNYILNGKFHTREDSLMNLDCVYWEKLLDDSNIRQLMPYTEYSELLGKFKTRNKEGHIPFNKDTVSSFIEKLSNSKPLLFANKVNHVLNELDYNYKNNQGSMLPAMFILHTSYSNFPSWQNCEKIDDLRYSIRQIYQMDLEFEKTQQFFSSHFDGAWHSIDNDLIRLKRFKNGNVHILLSDKVYDKLNEVIALINKNIIPESCKKIRKKTYKFEGEI